MTSCQVVSAAVPSINRINRVDGGFPNMGSHGNGKRRKEDLVWNKKGYLIAISTR